MVKLTSMALTINRDITAKTYLAKAAELANCYELHMKTGTGENS